MNYSINAINATNTTNASALNNKKPEKTVVQNNSNPNSVAFQGFYSDVVPMNNKFSTPDEKAKYDELSTVLTGKDKVNLSVLLKTGRLLDKSSNDGTTTLDNLYKIYKTPRITGLPNEKILAETVLELANPFVITQNFGDIPKQLSDEIILKQGKLYEGIGLGLSNDYILKPNSPKIKDELDVRNSGCCVAASIQFNLADKKPAEFARYVENLTGPQMAVKTKINYKDISPNITEALGILSMFNAQAKAIDWNNVEVTIAPDREAIVRSRIQNSYLDNGERNMIDVLMQSSFMQLGSQGTYNSLTDKRYGSLNSNDKGLTEFEKNFAETIVDNNGGKTSVTYQNVDDNANLVGYNVDYDTVKDHLMKALAMNSNVIIGITEVDDKKKIIGGHEITVIGSKTDKNGDLVFIYNDTDDNYVGKTEIKAKDLIPKIHHAGIPNKILNITEQEDTGRMLLKEYSQMQKNPS